MPTTSLKAFRLFTVTVCFLVLLSMTVAGAVLYVAFQNGRNYRDDQSVVWHNVICLLETGTRQNKKASPADRQKALLYYDEILRLAHAEPCKPA